MPLTHLFARLLNPVVWRSERHAGRRFWRFAHAEAASRLDLFAAANATPDPERAALYLRHALDEGRHAQMFALAASRRRDDLPPVRADDDRLFERLGETGFLAFVHHGESRGCAQFEAYSAWFAHRDVRTAALFDAVLVDERRHRSYTRELLVALTGEKAASRAVRSAAAWEAWRMWRRAGSAIAQLAFVGLLLPLYAILAPLAIAIRWIRPARSGWTA